MENIRILNTEELVKRGYYLTNKIKTLDEEKKAINTELANRVDFEDKNSYTDIIGDIRIVVKQNWTTKWNQEMLQALSDEHKQCCKVELKPQTALINKAGFQEDFQDCCEVKEGQAGVKYEYIRGEEE